MNPGFFGEDVSFKMLSEIFDHVVAFEFAMDQDIETDLFLPPDGSGRFLAQEGLIGAGVDDAFAVVGAGLSDGGGLGE